MDRRPHESDANRFPIFDQAGELHGVEVGEPSPKPEVRSAGQTVTYTWPAQHATARGTVLQLPTSFHTRITLVILTGGIDLSVGIRYWFK